MLSPSRSRLTRPALLAVPALLSLGVIGCSSTPQQATTPTTIAPTTSAAASAPTTAAPKGTTPNGDVVGGATTGTDPGSAAPETTEAPASQDTGSSLPPGATAGLDDWDQNGEPDPTCGTQDFGGGLVLRIPCEIGTAHAPPEGTVLVKDSLYRLPGPDTKAFEDVSATLLGARDADGNKVALVFFNSDAMFGVGSSTFDTDATGISLDATLRFIASEYPGGTVQVRGHTDNAGTDAANQQLSEARAKAVKDYFDSHRVAAKSVTAIGFGETQPLVENQNPDGTDNPDAMNFNRRVEIVVTVPAGR